jgi:hypothetical protein
LKVNRRFGERCRFHLQSQEEDKRAAGSKLRYPTLDMQATYYFETSVDFQRTTRRYVPEARTLGYTYLFIYN